MTVNNATDKDWDLEQAFNYSISAEYMIHDNFHGRISRATKAINYHKNK